MLVCLSSPTFHRTHQNQPLLHRHPQRTSTTHSIQRSPIRRTRVGKKKNTPHFTGCQLRRDTISAARKKLANLPKEFFLLVREFLCPFSSQSISAASHPRQCACCRSLMKLRVQKIRSPAGVYNNSSGKFRPSLLRHQASDTFSASQQLAACSGHRSLAAGVSQAGERQPRVVMAARRLAYEKHVCQTTIRCSEAVSLARPGSNHPWPGNGSYTLEMRSLGKV